MKKGINLYKEMLETKSIQRGLIVLTQHSEEMDSDILLMDFDGVKGIIKREDVDYQVEWKSLVGFIGREVLFCVKEIDEENGIVYCSRKEAQELTEPLILARLEAGEEFAATISGLVGYGAYVDIEGVYALMKNVDFSDDYVAIKDVLAQGDPIKVRLKKLSENNRITVEPVEKHILKTVMRFDSFAKDQVLLGVVNGVKPWGAYVTIAPGLDALCPIPPTGEIEEGTKVTFRIVQVQEDKKRVRGKILRILHTEG